MKLDPKVIEFATKLAALMREYDVTFDVIDETRNWETYAVGIDINLGMPRDHEWNGSQYAEVRSTYIVASDIEKLTVEKGQE